MRDGHLLGQRLHLADGQHADVVAAADQKAAVAGRGVRVEEQRVRAVVKARLQTREVQVHALDARLLLDV